MLGRGITTIYATVPSSLGSGKRMPLSQLAGSYCPPAS